MSINSPYFLKKCAPIVDFEISAIKNIKGNSWRKFKCVCKSFWPYEQPLAAISTISHEFFLLKNVKAGKTEISAPLSIRSLSLFVNY